VAVGGKVTITVGIIVWVGLGEAVFVQVGVRVGVSVSVVVLVKVGVCGEGVAVGAVVCRLIAVHASVGKEVGVGRGGRFCAILTRSSPVQ
jgi:hypothetical protein